jgi:hypothetical protein
VWNWPGQIQTLLVVGVCKQRLNSAMHVVTPVSLEMGFSVVPASIFFDKLISI